MSALPDLPSAYQHLTGYERWLARVAFWATERGLTRAELAVIMGMPKTTLVSRFEKYGVYSALHGLSRAVRPLSSKGLPCLPPDLANPPKASHPSKVKVERPLTRPAKPTGRRLCQYWLTSPDGGRLTQCGEPATHGPYCRACHDRAAAHPNPFKTERPL